MNIKTGFFYYHYLAVIIPPVHIVHTFDVSEGGQKPHSSLDKNTFKTLSEVNMRLQQTELD